MNYFSFCSQLNVTSDQTPKSSCPQKAFLGVWLIIFLIVIVPNLLAAEDSMDIPGRERLSFDASWHFIKDDPSSSNCELNYTNIKAWVGVNGDELNMVDPIARPKGELGADLGYIQPGFDDSAWRHLNLPHDWGIEGSFKQGYAGETGKLPYWGVGWYRKHFEISASDVGRRIYLDIDGAMSYANVWLNGHYVGGWPYGYASWRVDLTPYIRFGGENVLAIRLDNPTNSSRWYPGGGIYRNVWLVKTSNLHVAHWGTYVTTPQVAPSAATVRIRVNVDNDSDLGSNVSVKNEIY
jgi:beta-galactosidase